MELKRKIILLPFNLSKNHLILSLLNIILTIKLNFNQAQNPQWPEPKQIFQQ